MDIIKDVQTHLRKLPDNFYGSIIIRIQNGNITLLEVNRQLKVATEKPNNHK